VPNGGLGFTLEGANVSDPGQIGGQVINVNQDMTAQVSILNSAFGAEHAKGRFSSRNSARAVETNFMETSTSMHVTAPRTQMMLVSRQAESRDMMNARCTRFTIGGLVLIPGLNFNRSRNKFFFFSGYEYNYQHPAGTLQGNAKLKRLLSELSLEKPVLKDIAAEPSCQH